ncbi:Flagellar basal-body rod protein FlgG [Baekduia alba]|uniref:flagellar hook-basal body protein n=1 Tax=Baekduia alba TaxID=2997333 RepID=UPI002341953D|nr:flagellar hook-basal body protein [Baekduia alba]WCB91358.1 Flagellar basal-body rod protein FlgG [Baekduia alba]
MERGLYIAAAGMVAEMVRQDQIANDLANAATPGYKSDRSQQRSFSDLLLQNTKTGETVGSLGSGPLITKQVTDLSPEALRSTQEPLDLGIAGPGYFAVQTDKGVKYTRDGSFKAAADGTLTDQLGNSVLGTDRKPVKVNADGTVDTAKVGNFALTGVKKVGDANFSGTAAGAGKGEVQSGVLESSGVDAGRTMVDMMASLRAFEAGQKAIQTIDGTLQQAAGQVGTLPQ